MKKHKWRILFSVCLLAVTTYIALDTFVIARAWNTDATGMNISMFDKDLDSDSNGTSGKDTSGAVGSDSGNDDPGSDNSEQHRFPWPGRHHGPGGYGREDNSDADNDKGNTSEDNSSGTTTITESSDDKKSWQDKNISITVKEYRTNDTTVYVADVTLSSAKYLKTAFAQNTYGRNVTQKTSTMAEANQAILAINGDNYGSQETGYVIRNGIVYREQASSSDVLCVYADGGMEIVKSSAATAQELVNQGVWQAFSFGPALVENGEIAVTKNQEVGKAMASNPRTAIGLIDNLRYILIVADGRTSESEGLSLYELADFMKKLGVKTAYNMDGGGSSTMVFNGEIINKPTTSGNRVREREVNDIVYIGS